MAPHTESVAPDESRLSKNKDGAQNRKASVVKSYTYSTLFIHHKGRHMNMKYNTRDGHKESKHSIKMYVRIRQTCLHNHL